MRGQRLKKSVPGVTLSCLWWENTHLEKLIEILCDDLRFTGARSTGQGRPTHSLRAARSPGWL